ncbi:hypothetical protein [Fibrisoma limi]|nr:hypothetical protein [Fibrisoma limi]
MKRFLTAQCQLLVFLVVCLAVHTSFGQSTSTIKDFCIDKNRIWILTSNGSIQQLDPKTRQTLAEEIIDEQESALQSLTLDQAGALIVTDDQQRIRRYNPAKKNWQLVATSPHKLFGVTFNRQNRCFLLTNKGIVDPNTQTTFFPDTSFYLNHQIRYKNGWFEKPTFFMDRRDNLWVGFAYGEWGGDLFIFDTKQLKFIRPQLADFKIELNCIQSICEDDTSVFVSAGMSHFTARGGLLQFNKVDGGILLKSDSYWKKISSNRSQLTNGEYIGPVAINPTNNHLYFYSQNGIFQGDLTKDLSTIENWQNLVKPTLTWTAGQKNAVGPAMNVLKMQFTNSGTLVFLTEHDGIGLYDKAGLTLVR